MPAIIPLRRAGFRLTTFTAVATAFACAAAAQSLSPRPPAQSRQQAVAVQQQPVRLLGLAFSPQSVDAGKPVKLMIRLTRPAPAGGFVAALQSGNPKALRLPATITIPATATGIGLTVTIPKSARGAVAAKAADAADVTTRAAAFVPYRAATLKVAPDQKGGAK